MRKPNLTQLLTILLASATALCTFSETLLSREQVVLAQSSPRGEMYVPSYDSGGALLPDWESITFRLMPAASGGGSLDLSSLAGTLGYGAGRQFTDWSQVNWKKARKIVKNLRQSIYVSRDW